jgi:hypothetical protein
MTVQRHQYWESSLSNYLQEVEYEPFKWGSHDCALFAAGAVKAMTGTDLAEQFRGNYDTARGAVKALREFGAGKLQATVTQGLGEPQHIAYAHRGDVVSYEGSLGICVGKYSLFAGQVDQNNLLDQTAQIVFEQVEAGDLPDDEAEPEIARGYGKTLIPVPTNQCDHFWRVAY